LAAARSKDWNGQLIKVITARLHLEKIFWLFKKRHRMPNFDLPQKSRSGLNAIERWFLIVLALIVIFVGITIIDIDFGWTFDFHRAVAVPIR